MIVRLRGAAIAFVGGAGVALSVLFGTITRGAVIGFIVGAGVAFFILFGTITFRTGILFKLGIIATGVISLIRSSGITYSTVHNSTVHKLGDLSSEHEKLATANDTVRLTMEKIIEKFEVTCEDLDNLVKMKRGDEEAGATYIDFSEALEMMQEETRKGQSLTCSLTHT